MLQDIWLNTAMTSIKISFSQPAHRALSQQLSEELGLPLLEPLPDAKTLRSSQVCDYLLQYDDAGLSLRPCDRLSHGAVRCEFASGANSHRRRFGGGNGQAIAKAVGVSGKFAPKVLDLTAGLGADGFVLAGLGCDVRLLERNPIVFSLLRDGLERARLAGQDDSELADIVARMTLIKTDAASYLSNLKEGSYGDIVYMDPMFPERKKSAAVKKEMQAFHRIVGADPDASELLDLALSCARYRLVIKRPASASYLADRKPSYSLEGKSTRFDIFAHQKLPG